MPNDRKAFPLFWEDIKELNQIAYSRFQALEDDFNTWCSEILELARKTFKEDDSCLLPKTPSAKRKQRGRKKKISNPLPVQNTLDFGEGEDTASDGAQTKPPKRSKGTRKRLQKDFSDNEENAIENNVGVEEQPVESEEEYVPTRSTRATRAASRAATAASKPKNPKKASRANKKKKVVELEADTDEGTDSMASSVTDQEAEIHCKTPTNNGDSQILRQTRTSKGKASLETHQTTETSISVPNSVPKTPIQNFSAMNMKDKVQAYESIASLTPVKTPVDKTTTNTDNIMTPTGNASSDILKTPDTVVVQNTASVTESETSFEHYEEIVYEEIPALPGIGPSGLPSSKKDTPRISSARKSTRASLRKSLKMLPSNQKLVGNQTSTSQVEEKPVRTRTRLRLKKHDKDKEPATESSEENKSETSQQETSSSTDTEGGQESSLKPNKDSDRNDKTRTSSRNRKVSTEKETEMGVSTGTEESDPLELEDLETDKPTTVDRPWATRSKMRQPPMSEQPETSNSDTKQELRRSTRNKNSRSFHNEPMDTGENEDSDNKESEPLVMEDLSVAPGDTERPRLTRSKMRQPPVSEEQPETRSTRTKTRKRQLEEESNKLSPKPKRSRSIVETAVLSDQDKTPTRKPHDNSTDMSSEDEIRSPCPVNKVVRPFGSKLQPSPCPADKVVRPHQTSFLNRMKPLNTTPLSAARINPGLVRSFIPGHSPAKKPTAKEIQERRKKELMEKEKKRLEVQRKREEEHKKKTEEIKKKREERLKRAQETREEKEKKEKENRLNIQKKMEEKRQLTLKSKEEKLKEERERQKMRLQKFEEAEERRKQEEEERKKKLVEQRENEKFVADLMHRKKEFEEQERLKKIELEKQKALERRHELEKEREREQAKLKAVEEEKQREWLKKKEERERLLAKEKAEREKIELEKKKERDLQLKKEMEKLKEQERLRIAEEERIREQQKKQDLELKKMVDKHNAQVQNQQKQLPKPNLNRTHSIDEPNTSQGTNNSYQMTPDRVYKPTTGDNYNIDDIKSDDDTDDDEAPRKQIPEWAQGTQLKTALIKQHLHPPNLDLLFDPIQPPDLNKMFAKKRERFNKRTSSAHWDSPILKPGLLGRT